MRYAVGLGRIHREPVTRFLKVPELPDSKYSDLIVDYFGFATRLTSTEPVLVARPPESPGTYPFLKIAAVTV